MGDGVNIAAQLEGVAEPGAICLSEDAYRQVSDRLDLEVTDLGSTQLRNIERPIRAYSLQVGVPAQAKPATVAKPPLREAFSARPVRRGVRAVACVSCRKRRISRRIDRHVGSNAMVPAKPSISHRCSPLRQPRRRCGAGIFRRRHHRKSTTRLCRASTAPSSSHVTPPSLSRARTFDVKQIGKRVRCSLRAGGKVQRGGSEPSTVNTQLIDAEQRRSPLGRPVRQASRRPIQMQDEIVVSLASRLTRRAGRRRGAPRGATPTPNSMDLYFQGMAWLNKGVTADDLARACAFLNALWCLIRAISTQRVGSAVVDCRGRLLAIPRTTGPNASIQLRRIPDRSCHCSPTCLGALPDLA